MKNNQIGKSLFKKIFGWYIVVALLLTAFQLLNEYRNTERLVKEELNFLSKAFYDTLYNSIWYLDYTQINANADAIISLESVEGIEIIDVNKNILVKRGLLFKDTNQSNIIKKSFDIIHKEDDIKEKIASVTLYSSDGIVFERLQSSIVAIVVIAIIKSILLLILFLYFTKKVLYTPLHRLINRIQSMHPSKHEEIELKNESDNELTVLAHEYNNMGKRVSNLFDEIKISQENLVQEHKYLQSIIDSVDDPIMVIKDDYSVELMNSYLSKYKDKVDFADSQNPKCYEISHNRSTPCDGYDHPCPLKDVVINSKPSVVVHTHVGTNGNIRFKEISATPLFDKNSNCIGIIEATKDITSDLQMQDELREQKNIVDYQANYDKLTGLANRALFNEKLKNSIKNANSEKKEFGLLFIDLDLFKHINDSLGHVVGDKVLQEVSKRLKNSIGTQDTLSRIGSDEFAIIQEKSQKGADASILAQEILCAIKEPIIIDEHTLYLSSSIGISIYPKDYDDEAHNLIKYADTAMHKAKAEGRNNFQFYSVEMTELAYEKVIMQTNLRKALDNEEFVVYYQPQMKATYDKLLGIEALIRWEHPSLGLIQPYKFIPLAEETGLIVEIDRWVMKTAMKQVKEWYDNGLNPGILSLNLASKQLESSDYLQVLKDSMIEFDFKAEWLKLEVTESDVMVNPEKAIVKLKEIYKLGIKIAIDDFGTGYSSLTYLKRFPITELKIDKSFVNDIPENEEDAAIIRAVIALASSLNLDIIAEGVETVEQKEFLLENRCENIQGYLYSKPINANDFKNYLSKH